VLSVSKSFILSSSQEDQLSRWNQSVNEANSTINNIQKKRRVYASAQKLGMVCAFFKDNAFQKSNRQIIWWNTTTWWGYLESCCTCKLLDSRFPQLIFWRKKWPHAPQMWNQKSLWCVFFSRRCKQYVRYWVRQNLVKLQFQNKHIFRSFSSVFCAEARFIN